MMWSWVAIAALLPPSAASAVGPGDFARTRWTATLTSDTGAITSVEVSSPRCKVNASGPRLFLIPANASSGVLFTGAYSCGIVDIGGREGPSGFGYDIGTFELRRAESGLH